MRFIVVEDLSQKVRHRITRKYTARWAHGGCRDVGGSSGNKLVVVVIVYHS